VIVFTPKHLFSELFNLTDYSDHRQTQLSSLYNSIMLKIYCMFQPRSHCQVLYKMLTEVVKFTSTGTKI